MGVHFSFVCQESNGSKCNRFIQFKAQLSPFSFLYDSPNFFCSSSSVFVRATNNALQLRNSLLIDAVKRNGAECCSRTRNSLASEKEVDEQDEEALSFHEHVLLSVRYVNPKKKNERATNTRLKPLLERIGWDLQAKRNAGFSAKKKMNFIS